MSFIQAPQIIKKSPLTKAKHNFHGIAFQTTQVIVPLKSKTPRASLSGERTFIPKRTPKQVQTAINSIPQSTKLNNTQTAINLNVDLTTDCNEDDLSQDHHSQISPGKMREVIYQSRAHIHQLISNKTVEIEENLSILRQSQRSLTPNSRDIDFGIIDALKKRRLQQKSQVRDAINAAIAE